MTAPDLFSWTPPVILGDRDGSTFSHARDGARLNRQAQSVFNAMADGQWKTLSLISTITGEPEASVSARLRDLKKSRFGAFTIEKRYVSGGLWEYRMVL